METQSLTQQQPANELPSIVNTFDDLIPKELKQAYDELEKKEKEQEPRQSKQIQTEETPEQIAKSVQSSDDNSDDDDDIEITSSDDIDKLISGDTSAISKKNKSGNVATTTTQQEKEWYANEKYKNIINRAKQAGLKQNEVDDLIQEITDSKVIKTSNYTQKVEKEKEELAKVLEQNNQELARLKKMEKTAYFDLQPETQEEFGKPMAGSIKAMKEILEREGATVPVHTLAMAKDRVELNNLLKDEYLDQEQLAQLVNHWRAYKDVEFRYTTAKQKAGETFKGYLNTRITKEDVNHIMKNTLIDFVDISDNYGYIKDVVLNQADDEELEKEAKEVIQQANSTFEVITQAISNPVDYARNRNFLSKLAEYTLDAAHSKNIEKKYYKANEEVKELKAQRDKLAKAYKELVDSGKGISGTKYAGNNRQRGNDKSQDLNEMSKRFSDYLNNKIKFDDLM